jgi:hypothetical protein
MKALPNPLCPLCGGANHCAAAAAGRTDVDCWCRTATFSPLALARVPVALVDRACLCPRCAAEPAHRSCAPPQSTPP